MSKRFYVTLPDHIGADLDRWADSEAGGEGKGKPATLAAFLLEQAVRVAKDSGKIPQPRENKEDYESFAELVMHHFSQLLDSGKFELPRIQALMSGEEPTEIELLRVALIGQVSEEYASSLSLKKRGNGHGTGRKRD